MTELLAESAVAIAPVGNKPESPQLLSIGGDHLRGHQPRFSENRSSSRSEDRVLERQTTPKTENRGMVQIDFCAALEFSGPSYNALEARLRQDIQDRSSANEIGFRRRRPFDIKTTVVLEQESA